MKQRIIFLFLLAFTLASSAWSQEYKYNIERSVDRFTGDTIYSGAKKWLGYKYQKSFKNGDTLYLVEITSGLVSVSRPADSVAYFLFKDGSVKALPVSSLLQTVSSSYGGFYSVTKFYIVSMSVKKPIIDFFIDNELVAIRYNGTERDCEGKKLTEILSYLKSL